MREQLALRWRAWRAGRGMGREIRAEDRAARRARKEGIRARRAAHTAGPAPASLRPWRQAALLAIAGVVIASAVTSLAESYRALYEWADGHKLHGTWAAIWPLQVDTFIVVGELVLFVALVDSWQRRHRAGAWLVTLTGLGESVAGNIGHVWTSSLADRATAAVPPLAAAAALALGLQVVKRVVSAHTGTLRQPPPGSAHNAAKVAYEASVAGGNPLSKRALIARFGITREESDQIVQTGTATMNGNGSGS